MQTQSNSPLMEEARCLLGATGPDFAMERNLNPLGDYIEKNNRQACPRLQFVVNKSGYAHG